MNLTEILNHLGEDPESYFGAVVPPIFQSTNFRFKTLKNLRLALKDETQNPVYTRGCNPTVRILRQKVAALEGTEDALIFSSGSAAVAAAVMSVVKAGDHIVCVQKPYGWTAKLLNVALKNLGIDTTYVTGTDIKQFEAALRPNTRLIFLESPNSWTFEVQDLKAVANLAKSRNISTIIDNSCATPLSQKPAQVGVDIVVHSASKYLAGHSDVVAGALCASKERVRDIFYGPYMTMGGIISPNDAWLMLRGLRTLELRYNRSCESTEKVVHFLENHEKIEKVLYTHSPRFAQYELAKSQLKRGGGLFSIVLKTTEISKIEKFCEGLRVFQMAVSWGGYESLHFPACAFYTSSGSSPGSLPINMIRLYIGFEDANILIEDLKQSLDSYC